MGCCCCYGAEEKERRKRTEVPGVIQEPDDLEFWPHFPDENNSLLKRHLNVNVWGKLRILKDNKGFNFKQAIFTGCINAEDYVKPKRSEVYVGVKAGSADSYTKFGMLFNRIIYDYHDYMESDDQVLNMKAVDLYCPPFKPEVKDKIISTRIRVCRNYADLPFAPACTAEDRQKVIERMKSAIEQKLGGDGELGGNLHIMHPKQKGDAAIETKLKKHNLLFQQGDESLKKISLYKDDWPQGRAVYYNNKHTFAIQINREDHLQVISMEEGANIQGVFSRLCKAMRLLDESTYEKVDASVYKKRNIVAAAAALDQAQNSNSSSVFCCFKNLCKRKPKDQIQQADATGIATGAQPDGNADVSVQQANATNSAMNDPPNGDAETPTPPSNQPVITKGEWAKTEDLGYLTVCPTNVGTTLRASVHVRLPCLSKNMDEFNSIADRYGVMQRKVEGKDFVFDIANKRKLGRSEPQLVQDMYDGIVALINEEISLEQGASSGAQAQV